MLARLRARPEWRFFGVLPRAHRGLAVAWWTMLVLRGIVPAGLAVATGAVVSAIEQGGSLALPLTGAGVAFLLGQVLAPLHAEVGSNLGDRVSGWLNDQLMRATLGPQGIAHLERRELVDDLVTARDFDLGITGPPMRVSMGFIAQGLADMVIGLASAAVLVAYAWWAPLVLVPAWGATHWLLRESAVWRDRQTDEVELAQRHADYSYRLAVDAPAAMEIRVFGLARWVVDRFADRRRHLVDLRWEATRLRQKPLRLALLLVVAANALVFWRLAVDAADDRIALGSVVTFAVAALGVSSLAFGGLNWSLSVCADPVVAVLRLGESMTAVGSLPPGERPADGMPSSDIRFEGVRFAYPGTDRLVLDGFDLTIPAGTSLAIVGQNGAGKTTLAKLLCRLHDVDGGAVLVDGVDVRDLELDSWRSRVTAVFQDFVRFELSLRDNVDPHGQASDDDVLAALHDAGADGLADLDTVLSKAYEGGTDLSGGQWQRIALARALCAVRTGAGLVILDEPTAQLDVRGEAEVFERILAATRHCTTILVSHRFSTVRHVDRICVLDAGRVVELGTHDELMALGGRYRTMFDLQASRFTDGAEGGEDEELVSLD